MLKYWKHLAAAFAACLVLVLLTQPAEAVGGQQGAFTYELKGNGTAVITKFDWSKNGAQDIYIPEMINGYTVTAIGDLAFSREEGSLIFDTYSAYWEYTSVSVTLPETIVSIGVRAFEYSNISAINIPSGLRVIGAGAFHGCTCCQFKLVPNHPVFAVIENGLYHKANKELIAYSHGAPVYKRCTITIPEGILSIGEYAFAELFSAWKTGYPPVVRVELPSSLVSIGDYAFYVGRIEKLAYKVTKGSYGYVGCSNIQLYAPDMSKLTYIGDYAFYRVESECFVLRASAVETIGQYAFLCDFDADAEDFCIDLTGSPLHKIGYYAFASIPKPLRGKVIIPTANCSNIGENNYALGSLMTSLDHFSPDLVTIPTGLEPKCNELPPTVRTIESKAYYASSLSESVKNFRLPSTVSNIAADAFPKGSTFIVDPGSYAEYWCMENGFGYTYDGQDSLEWLN